MFRPWRSPRGSGAGRPGAVSWERNRLHCGRGALHALPVPKGRGVTDGCIPDIPFGNSCLSSRIKGQLCLACGKGITSSTMIGETGSRHSVSLIGVGFSTNALYNTHVCVLGVVKLYSHMRGSLELNLAVLQPRDRATAREPCARGT